jgi:hypothetical protein
VPAIEKLPRIEVKFATDPQNFMPYARDEKTLARPWRCRARPVLNTASAASKNRTSPATSTTILKTTI